MGWQVAKAANGRDYYWKYVRMHLRAKVLANSSASTETKQTVWDKPADFDAPSSVRKMVKSLRFPAYSRTAAGGA